MSDQPRKSYMYHKPSEQGVDKISRLRAYFSALHDQIEELAPASRERSLALTELETAAMWAIKAVVVNDPQSEVELLVELLTPAAAAVDAAEAVSAQSDE